MSETERIVYINGRQWIQVPSNSTQAQHVYEYEHVVRCGGDPMLAQATEIKTNVSKKQ